MGSTFDILKGGGGVEQRDGLDDCIPNCNGVFN